MYIHKRISRFINTFVHCKIYGVFQLNQYLRSVSDNLSVIKSIFTSEQVF